MPFLDTHKFIVAIEMIVKPSDKYEGRDDDRKPKKNDF
jgi:hypothetical protein